VTEKASALDQAYLRLKRIWSPPVIFAVIVISIATYIFQYSRVTPDQEHFVFFSEAIKPFFPIMFAINALYKYNHSKVKSWMLFFVACCFWFVAQTMDFFNQAFPAIREQINDYVDYLYYPLFPLSIVGVVGIGLYSYSRISKARIIFDGFTLASSVGFFVCSGFLLASSSTDLIRDYAGVVFLDLTLASIAFSITMFRGLDRVILPVAQALFFNSIADIYQSLYPAKNDFITHPVAETLTIIAIVSYTFTFRRDEAVPTTFLTSKGEDILRYCIFGTAFISLIYASFIFLRNETMDSLLWIIFGFLFASLLAAQLLTHYENRKLLRQRELDLEAMTTSEEKFRIAFENGPTTLVLLDEEGRILRSNRAFCSFTGFDDEDILGSALSYIIHPDDRTLFDVNLATVLGQLSGESINVECRFLQRDGSIRWGSASISHIPLTYISDDEAAEFVVQIEDITDQKVHESELKSLAVKDPLTGLWNRSHFFDLINEYINVGTGEEEHVPATFAVMFLDLDRFKIINDTMGHGAGDVVLHITSERITSIVGTRGEVARLGGDEFVILLTPPVTETVANLIAQEIKETLSQPILSLTRRDHRHMLDRSRHVFRSRAKRGGHSPRCRRRNVPSERNTVRTLSRLPIPKTVTVKAPNSSSRTTSVAPSILLRSECSISPLSPSKQMKSLDSKRFHAGSTLRRESSVPTNSFLWQKTRA
jgi:diguanylate cyclase (GGDEF)-like protein/PAS domain S-box-containing protein